MAKLYVVPTPVGNLEDMTMRAIRILKEADCVLAEDTRTSGILMKHFDIKTRMQSHHKFNEHKTVEGLVSRLQGGENIALISDAGTPAISDPGFCWSGNVERLGSMLSVYRVRQRLFRLWSPQDYRMTGSVLKAFCLKKKVVLHACPNWQKKHVR